MEVSSTQYTKILSSFLNLQIYSTELILFMQANMSKFPITPMEANHKKPLYTQEK